MYLHGFLLKVNRRMGDSDVIGLAVTMDSLDLGETIWDPDTLSSIRCIIWV